MNWEEIKEEYETTTLTLAALAEKYDIKIGTLKSRKSREGWSRDAPKRDATKTQKVATNRIRDASAKKMEDHKQESVVVSDELTDKQRLFCIYYVKSFNATQAAIKAGYSTDSAHVQGSRLIRNAKVAEEISRLKGEMQQGVFVDAMDVLNKYIQIAFADLTEYVKFTPIESVKKVAHYGEDGNVSYVEELPYTYTEIRLENSDLVDGSLLTELTRDQAGGIRVRLADKMKALEMLTKYFELLSDNDKRRLEEEKIKVGIEKTKAEIENLKGGGKNPESENWAQALLEVAERRKAVNANVE